MRSSVRPHLPEEELHAWLDGELSPAQRREIAEHLLACLICRALEGEVRALRARSSALLALASPARIRGLPLPARRPRRRLRPGAAAAAAVALAGGTWLATSRPAPGDESAPRLATAFVAPAILAAVSPALAPDAQATVASNERRTGSRARTLTLASRATLTPNVIGGRTRTPPTSISRPLRTVDPMAELAPSTLQGVRWESADYSEARQAGAAIAHLDGVPVSSVRLQPSPVGGRPTAMVRQLLADGRAVWVVEGTEGEVSDIARLLEASGLTMSAARRVRPDYIGSDAEPTRTVRVVTVASYLPYDSLESLTERLRVE
ncbi:MAG: zf-HC2 domain-containing protein [Gemmatimonadales bacterium]